MTVQDTAGSAGLPYIGRKTAVWLREMRLPFLMVSVLPALFGLAAARAARIPLDGVNAALALAGAVLVHIGANVINDYFDYRSGTDAANRDYVRGFTGGSRMIQEGGLTHREVLAGALLFLAAGSAAVLCLSSRAGPAVLFMGLAAVLAAVAYSLFLHSLVVGELVVGFCFGTLIPAGSFFVQAGFVSREVVLASVPMALLVFLILFINELPDYAADKASGKRTLVVRLGRKQAAFAYAAVLALVYAYIAVTAVALRLPALLLSLLTVPVAVAAVRRLARYYDFPGKLRPGIAATIALFAANSLVLIAAFAARGR